MMNCVSSTLLRRRTVDDDDHHHRIALHTFTKDTTVCGSHTHTNILHKRDVKWVAFFFALGDFAFFAFYFHTNTAKKTSSGGNRATRTHTHSIYLTKERFKLDRLRRELDESDETKTSPWPCVRSTTTTTLVWQPFTIIQQQQKLAHHKHTHPSSSSSSSSAKTEVQIIWHKKKWDIQLNWRLWPHFAGATSVAILLHVIWEQTIWKWSS